MQFLSDIVMKASIFLVIGMFMSTLLRSRIFRLRRTGFFVTLGVCWSIVTFMSFKMMNFQFNDAMFLTLTANIIAACAAALAFMIYRTMKFLA